MSPTTWLLLSLALALGAASQPACLPVIVTETVYVTATDPGIVFTSAPASPPIVPQSSPPATISSSTAAVYNAPAPPQPAPPANGVTFTYADKPKPTADHSVLCPDVAALALAGDVIPPMPFGAHLDANVATYDALPTLAASICQSPKHFNKVSSTPGHGTIKNSCNYEVYVDSLGCGGGANHELIPAGGTWSEPLRACPVTEGSMVYKVTKADQPKKPIQFEAGLAATPPQPGQENLLWYDISFLDCMRQNTTDLSACPGWEGGIQCVPGKQDCPIYVCGAGEYCDGSSYTVPEFGLTPENEAWRKKAGAPNAACNTREEGITFELCAAN